jgi:UPF0716 protein FxsA
MRWVLIAFIAIPLVEMLLLFEVAEYIGGLTTVGLVVLTAVIGVQILKRQGFATLSRANRRLESGQLPGQEIVEGLLLAFAGALLLTPGFITDTIGFICLTGPLRRAMARKLIDSGVLVAMQGGAGSRGFFWSSGHRHSRPRDSSTIEGEYREVGSNPGTLERDRDGDEPRN